MPTVLITGANRGLGLEFARQYAADGWRVHATRRDPAGAEALNATASEAAGAVTVHPLDVTDDGHIAALARALGGEAIDVLVNNAGVFGGRHREFGAIDYDRWEHALRVNTLGPMRMAEAFVEHVARSERKVIASISSQLGSIADNTSGGAYIYRSTKAALNAVVKSLSVDLAERGITVVALHPGWVATDMGGANAPLNPPDSVRGMRAVIEGLTPVDNGKFLSHDGGEIAW